MSNETVRMLYTEAPVKGTAMTSPVTTMAPSAFTVEQAKEKLAAKLLHDGYAGTRDEAIAMATAELQRRPLKPLPVYDMGKGRPVTKSDYTPPTKFDRDKLASRADMIQASSPDKSYLECMRQAEQELSR